MTPDDRLVARLLAREPRAWEELIGTYGGLIEAACRGALGKVGRADDAPDAAAEILRALLADDLRLLRNFRAGTSLGAYLRVIARTRTLNALKPLMPEAAEGTEDRAAPDDPVGASLERAERAASLRRALGALPERDREALGLFHLEGLDYAALAPRLGVPVDQVGILLKRAREKLRTVLGDDFLDPG